jgi:serine/threonine protein phosphatase PrpC
MKSFAMRHRGLVKEDNQDLFFVKEFDEGCILLAVADGLGGMVGGKRAAEMAKECLKNFNPQCQVVEAHIEELMHGRLCQKWNCLLGPRGRQQTLSFPRR